MSGEATSAPSTWGTPQETSSSSPSVPPTRKSSTASLFNAAKGIAQNVSLEISSVHRRHGTRGKSKTRFRHRGFVLTRSARSLFPL